MKGQVAFDACFLEHVCPSSQIVEAFGDGHAAGSEPVPRIEGHVSRSCDGQSVGNGAKGCGVHHEVPGIREVGLVGQEGGVL